MKIKILVIVLVCILVLVIGGFIFVSVKKDKAQEIILEDVNALEKDIEIIEKNTDIDGFKLIYEMEFYYQNVKYEYGVNLFSNEIVKREQEGQTVNQTQETGQTEQTKDKTITKEDAQIIALEDAGVPSESIDNIVIQEDRDSGVLEYDIEFSFDKTRYEYTVDVNGKITSMEKEAIVQ